MGRVARRLAGPVWLLTLGLPFGPGAIGAGGESEKLLTGFEEEDLREPSAFLKLERKEGKTKDGRPFVLLLRPEAVQTAGWTLFKGKATQGEYALGLNKRSDVEKEEFWLRKDVAVPSAAARQAYGLTHGGGSFNTCGLFRGLFPADWSGYALFRVDVHADGEKQTLRIALEDEDVSPPVVRTLTVEPNTWTTLEIDLGEAVRARGLDLKRMATLTIGVISGDGKVKREFPTLIDNLRLAAKGAPAKLPVVRDTSSLELPESYRASSSPQPVKAAPADHSPLSPEKPIVIPTPGGTLNPIGWVAAHDNKHLLVGFQGRNRTAMLLQSGDGGRSWKGLDGGADPTEHTVGLWNHRWDNADVVGGRPDVVVFTNTGCTGRSFASLRIFASKLTFTGQGWELRERPTLVDCDSRHCISGQSVVRTPDGRLWAAYGVLTRLCTTWINVHYSDDDGVTWKSWREGKSGAIPGNPESYQGPNWTYRYEEPILVPFEKGIACLWYENGGPLDKQLRWARFQEGSWSPIETVPLPETASKATGIRPPLHAVSLGGKEIFLVSSRFPGVLHYEKGKWTVEAGDVPAGSRISAAGDKAVVVVAATGPATLQGWQRSLQGAWSGPKGLAQEDSPLSNLGGGGQFTAGFVVQPYAPPNFVPVAWSCTGQKWIKVLRIPVR